MWFAILAFISIVTAGGAVYILLHIRRFGFVRRVSEKSRLLGWLFALALTSLPLLLLLISVYACVIAYFHLAVVWMLCDLVSSIWRRITKKDRRRYIAGAVAVIFTAVWLGIGWFCAHHVFRTEYDYSTGKTLPGGKLRVVAIADLHLGTTLDGEGFAEQLGRIGAEKPDIVVICGDFVDDDTKKADVVVACEALGRLETTYGVYYVYGNHDGGYFGKRDFTGDELADILTENGVRVLSDEAVLIEDGFYIVGRRDRSDKRRAEAAALTEGLDRSKYIIMLDHQPNDYDAESLSGADLVISGHTHGGHIFPAGPIGILIGANDRTYGDEVRGDTTFLVTSGISGWGIPFKTCAISEYVVVDISST